MNTRLRRVLGRRDVLRVGAAVTLPLAAGCGRVDLALDGRAPDATDRGTPGPSAAAPSASTEAGAPPSPRGLPAPGGPGQVIEVAHSGVVSGGLIDAAAVEAMMARGMIALTGRKTEADAWKAFFGPDDLVGIKVSPVGFPAVFSHHETVVAIVRGLVLAGVAPENIVVFERYRDYLDQVGYAAVLPEGVQLEAVVPTYAEDQTDVTGYDPNVFVDLPRVYDGSTDTSPRARRSHVAALVSRRLTKVINVPALKDHLSAGLTFALKNMTYGTVNNVSRSHVAPNNWTREFLPAIAALETLRKKVVLHIGDVLTGGYAGGPGPVDTSFRSFDYGALFFATDPVALDRVGWDLLDAERERRGLPPIAECGLKKTNLGLEAFDERQPDYVLRAAELGLGIADRAAIDHTRLTIG